MVTTSGSWIEHAVGVVVRVHHERTRVSADIAATTVGRKDHANALARPGFAGWRERHSTALSNNTHGGRSARCNAMHRFIVHGIQIVAAVSVVQMCVDVAARGRRRFTVPALDQHGKLVTAATTTGGRRGATTRLLCEEGPFSWHHGGHDDVLMYWVVPVELGIRRVSTTKRLLGCENPLFLNVCCWMWRKWPLEVVGVGVLTFVVVTWFSGC